MPLPEAEYFLRQGLLPENLPPVFTTKRLWAAFGTAGSSYTIVGKSVGEHAIYNASKRGGLRRRFGVPHPSFLKDKALFFTKHWVACENLFSLSKGSVSRPVLNSKGPRYVRITPHQELPKIRLQKLSRFRYTLVADVSRFFPSVYTHSIPWALHGKAAAKSDPNSQSAAVFGNRLDFVARQSQSRQTIGIPVGPDTSKLIAELLLSAVDKRFQDITSGGSLCFVRHVDDYWVGGHSIEECEKHLQNLRMALSDFELDINETKTRIVSTKIILGETWPSEFESDILRSLEPHGMGSLDPVSVFGKVIDYATREGDDGIIKHVIRVIDDKHLWRSKWEILEPFLAQCAVQFPHSLDYVARVIAWRLRRKQDVDKDMWVEISEDAAIRYCRLGYDSETVWALWLLKELNQALPKHVTDLIVANCGGLTLAFLAHFGKNGLASDKKIYSKLRGCVEGDPYSGSFWPLTLELVHLNRGDSSWTAKDTHSSLRVLHDAKASIIDWGALPKVFEISRSDDDDPSRDEPEYAIEDYGSDYGDDETEGDGDEAGFWEGGSDLPDFLKMDF
jgi:hypothetical protein